jgi:hypothetical protein
LDQRRPTVAKILVMTGTDTSLASTLATYKKIMEYAQNKDAKLTYPADAKPSKAACELLEDLLDANPTNRLGCRGGGLEEIAVHSFFDDFSWQGLEDTTMVSPFRDECHKTSSEFFADALKKTTFEAPPYVGDNRWCDDWDYTCTVGASVESGTDASKAAMPSLSAQRRMSNAPKLPVGSPMNAVRATKDTKDAKDTKE